VKGGQPLIEPRETPTHLGLGDLAPSDPGLVRHDEAGVEAGSHACQCLRHVRHQPGIAVPVDNRPAVAREHEGFPPKVEEECAFHTPRRYTIRTPTEVTSWIRSPSGSKSA